MCEEVEIYEKAIMHWGINPQINMAKEELAELIVAISHYQRERNGIESLISELADVEIVLKQLKLIIGISEQDIDTERFIKLERLKYRLSEEGVF